MKVVFFILPIIYACTDSFDCFSESSRFNCNGEPCLNNITELENFVKITKNLTMYFELDTSNITMLFELKFCQRFAIVFDYTKINQLNKTYDEYDITGKEIIIFRWVETYDNLYVNDNIGLSPTSFIYDEQKVGFKNWHILGYAIINETIRIKITRTLLTDNQNYYQFNKQTLDLGYLIIYNKEGIVYRNYNRGVITVDLYNLASYVEKYEQFTDQGHTIFLFIFWSFLSDIGIFFGRQLKSYPKYAKVHGMIFLFQSILTYIFAFSKIEYNKLKIQEIYYYDGLIIAHFIVGVLILSFLVLQLMMGMIVKNNLESLNGSNKIYKIKRIHFYLGYFIYLITKAQVAMGVHIQRPDLLIPFYYFYVFLFFSKISIEILYHYEVSIIPRRRITYQYVELDKNQIYENLIDKINQNISRNQLVKEYQKLNYIILREAIYDVSDFNHPGGQYILERITGREIGRYFYGGYPIQNLNIKMHIHTQFAINYIETRYLGDYRNDNCPLLYYEENTSQKDKYVWKFEQYIPFGSDVGLFIFKSHFFQVRQFLKGVQWFGRYFYIKPFGTGINLVERPYSIVMSYTQSAILKRQQILDYFKSQVIEQDYQAYIPKQQIILSNEINFVIKKCDFSNNMSRFLHCTGHKPYEITGPYGFGLELDPLSDGIHYAFVQGTGILPFLDLIDYLLRKAIYTILHDQRSKEIADCINDNNEEYLTTLGQDFQLIIHVAISDIAHFYGIPIIQDLLFICKTFHLDFFDIKILIKDRSNIPEELTAYMVESYFDLKYMKEHIKFKPTKVYVCGSPQFEEEIQTNLFDLGIPKKYLVIV
ncbi:unnamed protein product [Paramecium pentaurelia]|uniref:Cytochrome b5 heme-binding domain-containing protein n=1 Tax=Paramecium pentaurelia TaxID=43138 RepID=A0A8S1W236_9CILI|nr:unnamed protein product [Paramecium pentaurelia]